LSNSVNNNRTGVIGLDIGSSYVKAVSLNGDNTIREKFLQKTGYDYSSSVSSLLGRFNNKTERLAVGVTGYGRNHWDGVIRKTEISALARALNFLGIYSGTLVDIGGQDNKVLKIKDGRLDEHSLNRRCAAGTGSYLEFIAFRLGIETSKMDELAAWKGKLPVYHSLNSYCTVFAGTEILDCISQNIPLPHLIRGLYVSIVERIREMAELEPPVYLSGGVIAHHPVLAGIFSAVQGMDVRVVPNPQFLAAVGIALFAREHVS
jgi:predicted CoA-substrate-specific enzyme activase